MFESQRNTDAVGGNAPAAMQPPMQVSRCWPGNDPAVAERHRPRGSLPNRRRYVRNNLIAARQSTGAMENRALPRQAPDEDSRAFQRALTCGRWQCPRGAGGRRTCRRRAGCEALGGSRAVTTRLCPPFPFWLS
jgi:hypothetical protein